MYLPGWLKLNPFQTIRYSSEHKNLSLVARDVRPLEVYSAEFLVDNSSLAFLVSDSLQNLIIYMYQPEAKESAGGQRLVRKADINIGSHVTAFWRIRSALTRFSRSIAVFMLFVSCTGNMFLQILRPLEIDHCPCPTLDD